MAGGLVGKQRVSGYGWNGAMVSFFLGLIFWPEFSFFVALSFLR
jgi:hypothetical protein